MKNGENKKSKKLFLSYSNEDKQVALHLANKLKNAGLNVWFDAWGLKVGDTIVERIDEAVSASDVLLVLMSKTSVNSHWVQLELEAFLGRQLNDRAVTIIPILLEDCNIPPLLANKKYLDLRTDFETATDQLISQLKTVPEIDYKRLNGETFEKLIGDLLSELGFTVNRVKPTRDAGVDFIATFKRSDPFGSTISETWLVESKLYHDQRVSVSTLRHMLGSVITSSGAKGLIVTNGQLTSISREFITEAVEKAGHPLRVIDGIELTDLLMQYPQIVERYFGSRSSS